MQIYKYVIKISKFADMKKITSLFLLIVILFSACETEFNVNADWEEVTVVYGLLDQNQDKQYIRINKAFLGDEDAFVMASVADSINYNPNNLEVKIEKVSASGNVLGSIVITDTIHVKKDSGMFSVDENIIYVFDTDNFLNEEKEYKLTITNKLTGNVVSSETNLINELTFPLSMNFDADFGFISSLTGDYLSKTIAWNHSKNAAIYQMTLLVNYIEYGTDGSIDTQTVQKVYPVIDNLTNLSQKITGEEFLNLLSSVKEDPTVNKRVVDDLDLLFSVGTADLNTYINLNEPPTGIVQERDLYTNIDGGIGLFSARYNKYQNNIDITITTKQAIADSLGYLKFDYP